MPNIKSAKKRVAVTEKKNTQNKMIKSAVKTAVKKYNALLAAGDLAEAEKLLPETVSVIDSAVSKGILHKNNAANKKSALAKNLNAAKAAAEKAAAEEKAAAKEAKEEAKAAPAAEPVAEEKTRAKLFTSRNIAWFAVLLALTVVLQIWGSAIRIGANTVNFSLIPVVLAAILLGPVAGAVMGFASAVVILIYVVLGTEPLSFMMFQDHPFITVALILIKTTAAGLVAGVLYKVLERKNPYLATVVAAGAAPVVNTGLYILGALLMSDTIAASGFADGMSVIYFLVVVAAGVNFLIEFAVNMVESPAIYSVIRVVRKRSY